MSEETYPKHARSTVNRLRNRAAYDYENIHTIFNRTPILHVAFNPPSDEFPTILPMIGAMGSFSSPTDTSLSRPLDLYLHGYISSRLMKLPTYPDSPSQSIPLCVTATSMDGIVLALSPFHSSLNYSSASIFGRGELVTTDEEKLYAMKLITDTLVPSRWENSRNPPFKTEMQSTAILRVKVENASAKIRDGGASEDRKDERNEDVRGRIWSGVVPTWIAAGEPVPAKANVVEVPEHVREVVRAFNGGEERAVGMAREVDKKGGDD